MKFIFTSFLLALTASFANGIELTYYSGSDVSSYDEAVAFCESKGYGSLATKDEWCGYATSNAGTVYGMAPIYESVNYIDVESACGIPQPTESPTAKPTAPPRAVRTSIRQRRPGLRKLEEVESILCADATIEDRSIAFPPTKTASGSGDPHFKTWSGQKFDYHGECDMVLVHNPSFANGKGLRVHIRTTRVKYFSYIERVAIQIGEEILEFDNDVESFFINGEKAAPQRKHVKTMFAGYVVRRDKKAISIRLDDENKAKIDLIQRSNGFPAVIMDGGSTDIFNGSLGLLGEWSTGMRIARDGETDLNGEDATAFALEWQVRDDEPLLFESARFPQYPTTCTPPEKVMGSRLGMSHMKEEAEKACASWQEDKDNCIFDVIATRDVLVAEEGRIEQTD